ncbi:MAG: BatA and WFA domain-containing protein [Planctomycetota bacterium]
MSFLRPELFPWLALLALIPLLYLVRKRSKKVAVPHLYLWDRVLQREGKTRVSRVRNILAIILQMAIAASLILAWAGPIRIGERVERGRILVLLDVSSSMAARREDGRQRLDAALADLQGKMSAWIKTRNVGIRLVGDGSQELQPFTSDFKELVSALDRVPTPAGSLDVAGLTQLIRKTREEDERLDLIYLGDGAALGDSVPEGIGFLAVGDERANAGLVQVELEATRGRSEAWVRASLAAFGGRVDGRVVLETAEGVEIASQDFSLDGGSEKTIELRAEAEPEQWLSLRLLPPRGDKGPLDALGADDEAAIWLTRAPRARVLIASDRVDAHLKAGLSVLGEWVDLKSASVVAKADWRKAAPAFDFVILQDIEEVKDLPAGRYLLLNSWAPNLPLARSELVKDLDVVRQEKGSLFLRGLDLRDLSIKRCWRCEVGEGAEVVLEGTCGALISCGKVGGVEFVHFAFSTDVKNSSLALLPSWPLLLKDVVAEFGRERHRLFPESVLANQRFSMASRRGKLVRHLAPRARALEPEGEPQFPLLRAGPSGIFLAPSKPGGYEFQLGERREWVAVNELGRSLSDIRPHWSQAGEPPLRPNRRFKDEVSWARWLAFFALLLLLLEWASYQFGWTD